MFSQTTEYSLRVMVLLATLKGTPATTRQIAAATRVPEGYLSKILQTLSRAGLVKSQRGLHGGSVLARNASDLTIYDVVAATGPLPRISSCPLNLPSHGKTLCALHRRLDDAMAIVEDILKAETLAEMVGEASTTHSLKKLGEDLSVATEVAEATFKASRRTPLTTSAKRLR